MLHTGSTYNLGLAKFNSSGTLQWQRQLGVASDQAYSARVDSSGNIIIAGNGGSQAAGTIIAKYDATGSIQWQRHLAVGSSFGTKLAFDSSDNIYLHSPNSGGRIHISKYNSSGTLQWQNALRYPTESLATGGVEADDSYVYIFGSRVPGAGDRVWVLARFPADGTGTGTYSGYEWATNAAADIAGTLAESATAFSTNTETPIITDDVAIVDSAGDMAETVIE